MKCESVRASVGLLLLSCNISFWKNGSDSWAVVVVVVVVVFSLVDVRSQPCARDLELLMSLLTSDFFLLFQAVLYFTGEALEDEVS